MSQTKDEVKPTVIDKVINKFMDKGIDKAVDKAIDKSDLSILYEAVDKFKNKVVDKAASEQEPNESEGQDVTYYKYGGVALAVGEETFTTVDATSTIVDHGAVTTAEINIKATAVAEGGFTYADAGTEVQSNFDVSLLIKFEEGILVSDGVSYDISNAKYIAIDFPDELNLSGEANHKIIVIERDGDPDFDPELYGNVAMFSIDAEAVGDTTYLSAEAATLTTGTLSISEISIDAAAA